MRFTETGSKFKDVLFKIIDDIRSYVSYTIAASGLLLIIKCLKNLNSFSRYAPMTPFLMTWLTEINYLHMLPGNTSGTTYTKSSTHDLPGSEKTIRCLLQEGDNT